MTGRRTTGWHALPIRMAMDMPVSESRIFWKTDIRAYNVDSGDVLDYHLRVRKDLQKTFYLRAGGIVCNAEN